MRGFFSENSDLSMTRLCLLICVVTACILAFIEIKEKVLIMGVLLGPSFTAKVVSKKTENSQQE